MTGFLDRLPAPVRHGLLAFFGAFVAALLPTLQSFATGGSVDWQSALVEAVGAGVAGALAAVGLAAGTSLTTQYGVGSGDTTGGTGQ